MTLQTESLLWCVAEATLLAGLGAVATALLLMRRRATSAAVVGGVTAAAILVTTALTPVKLPNVVGWAAVEAAAPRVAPVALGTPLPRQAPASVESAGGGIDVLGALRALRRSVRVTASAAPEPSRRLETIVVWGVLAGAVLGMARLGVSLASVFWLKRRSRSVEASGVSRRVEELSALLGVRRPVALRESSAVTSPATIGWRRPLILLPEAWRQWSDENLRATLAHELAHVARSDFGWRLTASVVRAVHFFNPIVHLLGQRLTLAQELAADRLAASAVGGAAVYARALADLALALDRPRRLGADPIMLPVFSTNLTRRMTMLRSKDGSDARGGRVAGGRMCAGLIVLAALGLTALRSAAEAPEAGSAAKAVERTPFAAKGPDVSFFGPVDIGMLVVQLDDLAKMEEFALATAMAESFVNDQLNSLKKEGIQAPPVRLAAIDYIAYSMRRVTAEEMAKNPVLAMGADDVGGAISEFAVRWVEATDVVSWARKHVPEADLVEDDGLRYVIAKLGDEPGAVFYLAQRDSHTVVASYSLDRLRKLALENGDDEQSKPWQELGGGLVRFRLNAEALPEGLDGLWDETPLAMFSISAGEGQPNPLAEARKVIAEATREMNVGLDLNPAEQEIAVRLAFSCRNEAGAKRVVQSARVFQSVVEAILQANEKELETKPNELKGLDAKSRAASDGMMTALRMMAEATFEVRAGGDDGADAWVELTGKLPDSVSNVMKNGGAGWVKVEPVGTTPPVTRPAYSSDPSAVTSDEHQHVEAVVPTTTSGVAEGKLFARPALNPAVLGQQDHGLFVVRVSELVKVSNIGAAYNVFRNMMMEELRQYGGVDEKYGALLDANAIDYIAGAPKLVLRKLPNEGSHGASVSTNVECHEFIIRFHDKVDWEPWIDAFTSDFEVSSDGFTYYELPAPAGDDRVTMLVAPRDDRTLVLSTDVERLRHLATCDSTAPSDLDAAWNSIDGGVFTFIANASLDVGDVLPTDELGPQLATIILQKSTQFGFALDADANRNSQVRMLLTAPHSEAAKEVQAACEKLAPLFIAELNGLLANPTALIEDASDEPNRVQTAGDRSSSRDCARYVLTLLESFSTRLQPQADGSVQVRLEGGAVLPTNIFTAYEYEVAEESSQAEGDEQLR